LTSAETLGTPSLRHELFRVGAPDREIPAGSGPVVICGHTFKAGDVLSVPSYTIHRSKVARY
jgi:benzoate 4-monooxygenase